MKYLFQIVLGLSIVLIDPAIAAPAARGSLSAVPDAAHINAVQDLLKAMQVENVMRRVAYRSRYPSERQRQEAVAKLEKTPASEIYRRLALPMALVISADTAIEMSRFYNTPYGKQLIYRKYNSAPQAMLAGMVTTVSKEEKKERKRAAYVAASKELADAEPTLEREAFKLLQKIHNGK